LQIRHTQNAYHHLNVNKGGYRIEQKSGTSILSFVLKRFVSTSTQWRSWRGQGCEPPSWQVKCEHRPTL